MTEAEAVAREQLIFTLRKGEAHMTLDEAIADFPPGHINTRVPNAPYTFWHILEHVRICQWDILDYVRNSRYVAPKFPDDYWPTPDAVATPDQWRETTGQFYADLDAVEGLIRDASYDLFTAPTHAWEPHHTPYRTFLVLADHNAYHTGEIAVLRQVMGLWPAGRTDGWRMAEPPKQDERQ
jgi:hypothetical protein